MDNIIESENDQYTTILGVSKTELNIKKSKFIGLATSISTEQEGINFLGKIRSDFPGATHYCYAFSIGTGAKILARSSDAGEPANSAGKPILQAVETSGLSNIICVVVRYFGGIKLGVGGLIRAYGGTARDCIQNAKTVILIKSFVLKVIMPHNHIGAFVNLVSRFKGKILSMDHSERVKAMVQIRGSSLSAFEEGIKAIGGDILLVNDSKWGN